MTGAAARYAARVDAVLTQRTRLRGPQPPGDLFGNLPDDHPLLKSDARRDHDAVLTMIASYVEPDDVVVDVGGGAGRICLPLALRCREVVAIDPSPAMGAGFAANAKAAGITNARFVLGSWPVADAAVGDVVLVNHVTYLTRDMVPFIRALERSARRRVILTVTTPPPPSWNRFVFELVHDEPEEVVPGHAELANVLWELGVLPDIRVLPAMNYPPLPPSATRVEAVEATLSRGLRDQWAGWPLEADLEARARATIEARFEELFEATPEGFIPTWGAPSREVLITWEPGHSA
jgi:hypothetical protein